MAGLRSPAVAVSAGVNHTSALTREGGVTCWGANREGQLGDGTPLAAGGEEAPEAPAHSPTPVDVVGLAAGRDGAATTEDYRGAYSEVPVATLGFAPGEVTGVSAGSFHTCVTVASGEVRCWGSNSGGELGDGTTLERGGPVTVAAPAPAPTGRDVVVNIIVLDSTLELTADPASPGEEGAAEVFAQLGDQDPALLRAVAYAFGAASSGALNPVAQVVQIADPLDTRGQSCLERWGHGHLVEPLVRQARVEGAINVVVVRAPICSGPGEEEWAGYDDGPFDGTPVVGWAGLDRWAGLVHVMIHEYGHDVGLEHAGVADCSDAVGATSCTTDEVGDAASVMSYVWGSDAFTVAELFLMGLLAPEEFVTEADAVGTDVRLRTTRGEGSVRLLILEEDRRDPDGRVFISGEPGHLEVRFFKTGDQKSLHGAARSQRSLAVVTWDQPEAGTRIHQDKNVSVTYAGADADGSAILEVRQRR